MACRYTDEQCTKITRIYMDVINNKYPIEAAKRNVLEVSSCYPIHNFESIIKIIEKYLSGTGFYGFGKIPANWAKALLEITNNDILVIKAFKQQQELQKENEGKLNKRLERLLESI